MEQELESQTSTEENEASWSASVSLSILFFSAVTGSAAGLVCVGFRFVLRFLQLSFTGHSGLLAEAANSMPPWQRILIPVLGALAATLILKLGRTVTGKQKAVEYVEAARFYGGQIPFPPTFWRAVSSCVSIASGAAIGREGSMIQFASAVISKIGQRWQPQCLPLQTLLTLGVAGAVAAVYQAPVAGACFALEIVLGTSVWSRAAFKQLPALLVSAGAGSLMSHFMLGSGPLFCVTLPVQFHGADCFPLIISSACIAVLGTAYFHFIKSANFLRSWPLPLVLSAIVVGILSCIQPETWGNGDSAVLEITSGRFTLQLAALVLLLRLIATAACAGSGVVGGVFTPTVFTGSALGLFCSAGLRWFFPHLSAPSGYAVVGIASLLAAVTHAPLMAAFMSVELTGTPEWLPVTICASLLSWQIAKRITSGSLYAVAEPNPTAPAKTGEPQTRH